MFGDSLVAKCIIVFHSFIAFLAAYSHFKTMTTHPGAVPHCAKPISTDLEEFDVESAKEDVKEKKRFKKHCIRCKSFKPRRAHHCSVCNRCVIKMDHHCPWVNNCVGIQNQKFFLLFLIYIQAACISTLILIVASFLACSSHDHSDTSLSPPNSSKSFACLEKSHYESFHSLMLIFEAILFQLFTLCMLADQWSNISHNTPHIDSLQTTDSTSSEKQDVDKDEGWYEVLGDNKGGWRVFRRIMWLVPIVPRFEKEDHERILGYTLWGLLVAWLICLCIIGFIGSIFRPRYCLEWDSGVKCVLK